MADPIETEFHAMPEAFLWSSHALCNNCLILLSCMLPKIEHKPPAYQQCSFNIPKSALW